MVHAWVASLQVYLAGHMLRLSSDMLASRWDRGDFKGSQKVTRHLAGCRITVERPGSVHVACIQYMQHLQILLVLPGC